MDLAKDFGMLIITEKGFSYQLSTVDEMIEWMTSHNFCTYHKFNVKEANVNNLCNLGDPKSIYIIYQ